MTLQEQLLARGNRLPIIFITAFPRENAEAKALAAGAVCFLSKPFDGRVLINCVRKALARGASGTTSA